MGSIHDSVLTCVGKSPLIRLDRFCDQEKLPRGTLLGKLEFLNPAGSVKDRVALKAVVAAEKEGKITPGGTLIEGTSGNMGVGLAMIAAIKGYRCICVVSEKVSIEKRRMIEAFGAEVVVTPAEALADDPRNYLNVARKMSEEISNSFLVSQFTNLQNPQSHFETTGPEIWDDTEGKLAAVAGGVGTGGTISGVGKYLKSRNPNIKVIVGDPEGSIIGGHDPSKAPQWLVEGIGEDFFPETYDSSVADVFYKVSDAESFRFARKLCRTEGLLVGGSTGTILAAAVRFAKEHSGVSPIVVILPDSGRSYLTKMYNKDWLVEQGISVA